jgi:hypothetical protein
MTGLALYRKYRAITDIVKQFETSDASLVFRTSRNAFFPVFGLTACEYAVGYICPDPVTSQPVREKRQRDGGTADPGSAPSRKPRPKRDAVRPSLSEPSAAPDPEDFAGDSTFLQTVVPTNRPRRRSARLAKRTDDE